MADHIISTACAKRHFNMVLMMLGLDTSTGFASAQDTVVNAQKTNCL